MMKGKEGAGGQQEEEGGNGQRQEEEEACLYRWNSTKGLFPEPAFSLAIQKQGLLLCAGSPGDLWFLIFTVLCANPQSQICKQLALQTHNSYFSQISLFNGFSILLIIP